MEPMRRITLVVAGSGLLPALLAGCNSQALNSRSDMSSQQPATSAATRSEQPATQVEATTSSDSAAAPSTPPDPSTMGPSSGPAEQGESALVTHVVDGDTIDVQTASGEDGRIRIIGIDTPERGECNFGPATYLMKSLVLGKTVVLSTAGSEKNTVDRYGRWLRYVDVNSADAGLAEITAGLAIARYDSRDGYGWHPRESEYVDADEATAQQACGANPAASAPATAPTSHPPARPASAEPADYGTCRAAKVAHAVPAGGYQEGRDVEYHFYRDADHDGFVCE
jgi:endonuclease YncB( thermonuclease family)